MYLQGKERKEILEKQKPRGARLENRNEKIKKLKKFLDKP